jgi:putative phosphoribosyl transferase
VYTGLNARGVIPYRGRWTTLARPATSGTLRDREDAGAQLANQLAHYAPDRPVILALPRGGVPVGFEIAVRLGVSLDVLIVRKIGAPGNPEYGLGALVEDGSRYIDTQRVREAGFSLRDLEPTIARELEEVRRRAAAYRGGASLPDLRGRTVILVDDGVATGGSLWAAIRAVRHHRPRRVVVAVGVAPAETVARLEREADDVVVLIAPREFFAVGEWYRRFDQVSDEEVERLLERGRTGSTARD